MYWCRGTELFHSIRSNHAAHVMDETCISEHCRHRFSFLCDKHAENKEGCCSQMTLLMTLVPSWCHSNMDKAVRRPWPIHYWICKITASTPSTLWQHPMWLRCFLFWSQWIFNWCFSTLRANIELPRVTQDSDSLQKSHTKLKYTRGKWTTVFWDKEKNAILFNILYPLCRWTGYWS